MNISDFGFAVELFVIVFSFLCWLVYVPSVEGNNLEIVKESTNVAEAQILANAVPQPSVRAVGKVDDSDVSNCEEKGDILSAYIEDLSIARLRQIASLLKELNVIPKGTKTSGKGIKKKDLILLIQSKLLIDREAVIQALKNFDGEISALT
jgi:hypothetical protein